MKRFVQEFDENREIEGKIVTVDTDRLAAGSYFSHKHYIVPYYRDDRYREALDYFENYPRKYPRGNLAQLAHERSGWLRSYRLR